MTDKYQYVSDNLAAIKSNIADAAANAAERLRIYALWLLPKLSLLR